MPQFSPVGVDALLTLVARSVRARTGRRVVAIDGADAAEPAAFAHRLADVLRADGGEAAVVSLHGFVRPASVRLEYGKTDELSYRTAWFDYAALEREVLTAVRERGEWLPALWDEATDRSPRAPIRSASENAVIVVAGPMLLGRGLHFDVTVRLQMTEKAVRRKTPADRAWSISPLFDHDNDVADTADFTVRWDHPDRPALAGAIT
ncbi:hypothetical protein GCM10007304_23660 [Rhodococcoides trifolii]|uniref:Uridine kinase n=1 Tax=Rhodococcoides trifolii TaxID=908250 RepID=A0A917FW89_9NOCA|nr:hypothetical protein [Rhodococcus trifolii]GGG08847.1 hypothetical protein GCM10007304_23660 [Rhodococcus trifolii]